jgi:6-phosphogluconate dehydrogenase
LPLGLIRSRFLGDIKTAFTKNKNLDNLLFDNFFKSAVERCQSSWRRVVSLATLMGIPVPAFSTALSFFDGYRTARLPANLLQAQRDFFGAHTFEYENKPGTWVHVNWTGRGGNVSSSTYNA